MPRWTFWACKEVDRNRIGLLGICGWGGMALNDAAMDTRVKAVATSVMYDMSRAMGHGVGDGKDRYTTADRRAVLRYLNVQRWKDAANGTFVPGGHDIYVDDKGNVSAADRILPETLPANPNPVLKEFFDYYRMPRGFHPRSVNSTGAECDDAAVVYEYAAAELRQRSDYSDAYRDRRKAHSRYFAEDAFKAIGSRKRW